MRTKLLKMKFVHEGWEHEDDEPDVFFVSRSGAISLHKRKQPRKRHMTVARAMKQAAKAGLSVNNAVVKPDGVELRWNEAAPDQPNPWDSVQ